MQDIEGRMTVIQLTHEVQELVRTMNGVSIHVQNDVAACQAGVRCRRSNLYVRHDHSVLSRQTGNSYSPNFACSLQNGQRNFNRPLNSYFLDLAVSKDVDDERLSRIHLSQLLIQFALASHGVSVDPKDHVPGA